MTVRFLILGKAADLLEVLEMPILGEVLNLHNVDFVVANIRLEAESIGPKVIPHLYLLPVCQIDVEAA